MHIRTVAHIQGRDHTDALYKALAAAASKRLRPLLKSNKAGASILTAVLESHAGTEDGLRLKLSLYLPGRIAAVAESVGDSIEPMAEDAIAKLHRQARSHFAKLKNARECRRKARRARQHEAKGRSASKSKDEKSLIEARLNALRPALTGHARRELAYLRAVGEVPYGSPQVEDVVDEALTTVISEGDMVLNEDDLLTAALRQLYQAIDAEIEAERFMIESVPLNSEIPDDPEDDAEEMVEEEFYEFYQPDDHVTLADVLYQPDTQEQERLVSAQDEVSLAEVVKELPRTWRRAFLLLTQDRMAPMQIGAILNLVAADVEDLVKASKTFLEARFAEKGLADWFSDLVSFGRVLEAADDRSTRRD
jgi:DNA-directed RNA polymerase specialized sigma24 family protein/ribosome-associated translation inhibitor RaiA